MRGLRPRKEALLEARGEAVAQKAAGASFDARSSTALGVVGGAVGFDMAKEFGAGKAGGKGGYDEVLKKQAERKKKFGESLKPSDIEMDGAKQAVEATKNLPDSDPRKITAIANLEKLEGNKKRIDSEIKALESRKNKDVADIRDNKNLKNKETEERSFQDEIARIQIAISKTSDENERSAKQAELGIAQRALGLVRLEKAEIQKDIKTKIDAIEEQYEYQKKETANREVKSIADRRKAGYAKTISKPGWLSVNRVGFVGPVSRASKQAAAELRKGEKKVEDIVREALKKTGELSEEEEGEKKKTTEGAEPSTPPPSTGGAASGGPSTPPSVGGAPPTSGGVSKP